MKKNNKNVSKIISVLSLVLGLMLPSATFAAGPAAVNLLSAGNFTVLSKSGISTTGTTLITGDIGVSPITSTSITGFSLNLPTQSAFANSPLVVGKVYAPDYASPTPANLTTAISDMGTAYTDAMGRTNPTATELGAGNIGGLTITPGLYKWSTGVIIPTDVTLTGSANDVWIFQIAQTLTVSSNVRIVLAGGAQASNIFWVVGGQTTIGTTAVFNGNILDQTAIVLNTGARLNGRALAQTAVTLDSNSVTSSSSASVTPTPIVSPISPTTPPTVTPNPVMMISPYQPVMCTMDAKMCPDGSFVGRTGPSCQFAACPGGNPIYTNPGLVPSPNLGQEIKTIVSNIRIGSSDNKVATLQQFLMTQNKGVAARALERVGATGYFGKLTRSALAEFQTKVGIYPALGNFGPITRAYISTNY